MKKMHLRKNRNFFEDKEGEDQKIEFQEIKLHEIDIIAS
jgi:hypothetical protein